MSTSKTVPLVVPLPPDEWLQGRHDAGMPLGEADPDVGVNR